MIIATAPPAIELTVTSCIGVGIDTDRQLKPAVIDVVIIGGFTGINQDNLVRQDDAIHQPIGLVIAVYIDGYGA